MEDTGQVMVARGDRVLTAIAIDREAEEEVLAMMIEDEDIEMVIRGFMADAESTDIIEIRIDSWKVGTIGPDARKMERILRRDACPVCTRTSFWIEDDEVRAACHDRLCKAWIEPNSVDEDRIDCGWPSAQKTRACSSFGEAKRVLTRMRAEAEANTVETTDVVDASEF